MNESQIEWTRWTWDFLRGCSRESPGCENCYAERYAHRFAGPGLPFEGLTRLSAKGQPRWRGKVRGLPDKLRLPLSMERVARSEQREQAFPERPRVFVNSKSDTFHPKADRELVRAAYRIMRRCESLDFLVLTKRAGPMLDFEFCFGPPPINVWHGASVENQHYFEQRAPIIAESRASIRFLSVEPLLGPIEMRHLFDRCTRQCDRGSKAIHTGGAHRRGRTIDWVIVGGESGARGKARETSIAAIESIIAQCAEFKIPVYVKQLGTLQHWPDGSRSFAHGKGGDFAEWPPHLQIRQLPVYPRPWPSP